VTSTRRNRLIVVSNRLPFALSHSPDGSPSVRPGSGGLVTALLPVLRNRGGTWLGWPGTSEEIPRLRTAVARASRDLGCTFVPITISRSEYEQYYLGYSNESIWPLFHDLPSQCRFDPPYWQAYGEVNRRFAEQTARIASPDDFIWVHDYQLMMVGAELRRLGRFQTLAFFLHIPFPAPDIFMKLPERLTLLRGLLEFDLLGFQTQRDRRNFIQCVRQLIRGTKVRAVGSLHRVWLDEREVHLGAFPISIDYAWFSRRASERDTRREAAKIRQNLAGRHIILGVDRLDTTKGIPHRLEAFHRFLIQHPEIHGKVNLIQVVVPSRTGIPTYDALKEEIERLVGRINGEFTRCGWVPVHYMFRGLPATDLLAYYRASHAALVTPLKDGMNLVAKEYCTCNEKARGVLILSQFAGVSAELGRQSLVVNPNDVQQTADAIWQAITMPEDERHERMRRMRRVIRTHDIFWWVDSFMRAAIDRQLHDFPVLDDYIPELEDTGNDAWGGISPDQFGPVPEMSER